MSTRREREISDDEDHAESNKRAKSEPNDNENTGNDEDAAITVETEEGLVKKLVWSDLWSDEVQAVIRALTELQDLCCKRDEGGFASAERNSELLYKIGGHLAVFKAMEKHAQNALVQVKACTVIGLTTAVSESTIPALVSIDGHEKLLATMKAFPASADIQERAIGALVNISYENQEVSEHIVKDLNGVRLIVAAMNSFTQLRRLQLCACMALDNLSQHDQLIDCINETGARGAIAAAAERYPMDECIVAIASKATKQLWRLQ